MRSTEAGAAAVAVEPISPEPPAPFGRAVMRQSWFDLSAIHWRYSPDVVQRLLPDGFKVDVFDGSAWVGLIPFRMVDIRIGPLPPLRGWSTFPETNVRTYVVDPAGRRAVWFVSLDISSLVPVVVARTTYGLPYCWSRMSTTATHPDGSAMDDPRVPVGERSYTSSRRWPRPPDGSKASSTVRIRIGDRLSPAETTDLDHFLTARWALGSVFARRLVWARVDHDAWPIHRAELLELDDTLLTAGGLPAPEVDPIVRWSPGVEVRIERPRLVRR